MVNMLLVDGGVECRVEASWMHNKAEKRLYSSFCEYDNETPSVDDNENPLLMTMKLLLWMIMEIPLLMTMELLLWMIMEIPLLMKMKLLLWMIINYGHPLKSFYGL